MEVFVIAHPGTGQPIFGTDYDALMKDWFEGFNVPRKYKAECVEEFSESHARVTEWFKREK